LSPTNKIRRSSSGDKLRRSSSGEKLRRSSSGEKLRRSSSGEKLRRSSSGDRLTSRRPPRRQNTEGEDKDTTRSTTLDENPKQPLGSTSSLYGSKSRSSDKSNVHSGLGPSSLHSRRRPRSSERLIVRSGLAASVHVTSVDRLNRRPRRSNEGDTKQGGGENAAWSAIAQSSRGIRDLPKKPQRSISLNERVPRERSEPRRGSLGSNNRPPLTRAPNTDISKVSSLHIASRNTIPQQTTNSEEDDQAFMQFHPSGGARQEVRTRQSAAGLEGIIDDLRASAHESRHTSDDKDSASQEFSQKGERKGFGMFFTKRKNNKKKSQTIAEETDDSDSSEEDSFCCE
jgi:hypothetical protein